MVSSRIILPDAVIRRLRAEGATEIDIGDKPTHYRPDTPHISFSQLSMYLRCSMQYWFKYKQHLPEQPKVSLALGKGGHNALEKSVKRKLKSSITNSPDEVVQWASDFMDRELDAVPSSEMEKDVEPGGTKDKFLAATRVFQTRDAPRIKPIAAELDFTLDMNEFLPEPAEVPIRPVIGKIDLVSDDYQTRVVHEPGLLRVEVDDYKYVTRKRGQAEVNISPQLSLYATVMKKLTGAWPTKLAYIQIHPGTTKDGPDAIPLMREPDHMTVQAHEGRMRRLAYQFAKVEKGIEAGIFIPTDDPITCSWCPFRQRCQASLVDDYQAASIREATSK